MDLSAVLTYVPPEAPNSQIFHEACSKSCTKAPGPKGVGRGLVETIFLTGSSRTISQTILAKN
jgi:hypothetical protein